MRRSILAGYVSLCSTALVGQCLSDSDIRILIKNVPVAITVRQAGGCPTVETSMLGGGLAAAQLRNMCPRSGTGLIGNYVVDLKSGTIWSPIATVTRTNITRGTERSSSRPFLIRQAVGPVRNRAQRNEPNFTHALHLAKRTQSDRHRAAQRSWRSCSSNPFPGICKLYLP